ncbi:hypothetical protein LZ31DRAFT_38207 [Colletotrichum somersetense]|nr:hypothetical protein LZ31DRAFT_38207 [Colletotrichum somersetense]
MRPSYPCLSITTCPPSISLSLSLSLSLTHARKVSTTQATRREENEQHNDTSTSSRLRRVGIGSVPIAWNPCHRHWRAESPNQNRGTPRDLERSGLVDGQPYAIISVWI